MALSDILAAITAEADAAIAQARTEHAATMKRMAEAHAHAVSALRSAVKHQKNERLHQLKKRADDHVDMRKRHAVLQRKQELLDDFYASVTRELAALPHKNTEHLLASWLKALPHGGAIIPSKTNEGLLKKIAGDRAMEPAIESAGGFRFISDAEDRDYTYEFLVKNILRPDTEVEVAGHLFGSSR